MSERHKYVYVILRVQDGFRHSVLLRIQNCKFCDFLLFFFIPLVKLGIDFKKAMFCDGENMSRLRKRHNIVSIDLIQYWFYLFFYVNLIYSLLYFPYNNQF